MKCIINNKQIQNLTYSVGYMREKRVKNCYYFKEKYFFFFCEGYCEDFSLIKSAGIVEGDLSEIKPFVEFFNNYKEQLFEDPGTNVLMGGMSYEEEYLMENLGNFAKEVVFFPPMSDEVDLKGFEIDVDISSGVNPYFSAEHSQFNIAIAGVEIMKFGFLVFISFMINF